MIYEEAVFTDGVTLIGTSGDYQWFKFVGSLINTSGGVEEELSSG